MDASAIVSIVISLFSVAISIYLGVTALKISNKSDTTLAVIKTEINALRGDFMKRFEQAQTDYHEVIKIVVAEKVHRGEWSNEQAEDFEEEFKEAIKVLRRPSPDPTSILSKQSKLGK
jgi:hypothetical protein